MTGPAIVLRFASARGGGHRRVLLSLTALAFTALPLAASWSQTPRGPIGGTQFTWLRGYSGEAAGTGPDKGLDCAFDSLGNLCVAGFRGGPTGRPSFNVARFSPGGAAIHNVSLPGSSASGDAAQAVVCDAAQDAYACGFRRMAGTPDHDDLFVVKLNPAGGEIWRVQFDGAGLDDRATAIARDSIGNLLVVGVSRAASEDLIALKIRQTDGAVLWTTRLDSGGQDAGLCLAVRPSGMMGQADDVIVGGAFGDPISGFFTARLNGATGAPVWQENAGSTAGAVVEHAAGLAVDTAGDVFATGVVRTTADTAAMGVVKYRGSDGVRQFRREFLGTAPNGANAGSAVAALGGHAFVLGRLDNIATLDTVLFRLDGGSGTPDWSRLIGGPPVQLPAPAAGELVLAPGGRPLVTLALSPTFEFELAQFGNDGVLEWRRKSSGPDGAGGRSLAVAIDADANAGAAGITVGETTGDDVAAAYVDCAPPRIGPCAATPAVLPNTGGRSDFQVMLADNTGIAGAVLRVDDPVNGPAALGLADQGGGVFMAEIDLPPNAGGVDRLYGLSVLVQDATGNESSAPCGTIRVMAPADATPPTLSDPSLSPDVLGWPGGQSRVRVKVVDDRGVASVRAASSLGPSGGRARGAPTGATVDLLPVGDDYYEGDLPVAANMGTAPRVDSVLIVARDEAGNEGSLPAGTITVAAPGRLRVSVRDLNFGLVRVGSTARRIFTFRNVGGGPLNGTLGLLGEPFRVFIKEGKAAPQAVRGPSGVSQLPYTLQPGEVITVAVDFSPSEHARYRESLLLTSDDPAKKSIKLSIRALGCSGR